MPWPLRTLLSCLLLFCSIFFSCFFTFRAPHTRDSAVALGGAAFPSRKLRRLSCGGLQRQCVKAEADHSNVGRLGLQTFPLNSRSTHPPFALRCDFRRQRSVRAFAAKFFFSINVTSRRGLRLALPRVWRSSVRGKMLRTCKNYPTPFTLAMRYCCTVGFSMFDISL